MGWLCWNIGCIFSRKDIDRIFREQVVGHNHEVLKSCCRGYTWWVAAVRDKTSGEVWAATAKYHYNGKTGEFGYKWMDESYGPCYYNYPKSYFKLLTAPCNEYARVWREEVRKRWETASKSPAKEVRA